MAQDYYQTLGVERGATKEQIRKAYKRMAMKYHPDRNPDNAEAEAKFKTAAEAYDVLGDDNKRQRYDQYGEAGLKGGMGGGFSSADDIFSAFGDMFGGGDSIFESFFGGGGGRQRGPRAGASLKCSVQISFEEAVFGCEKTIQLRRQELCDSCKGSGAKAGTSATTCPYCHGTGQMEVTQGFFRTRTTCHKCQGAGQVIEEACPSCRGNGKQSQSSSIKITIPAGVDNDTRMRIAGEGEPGDQGGPRGDLYCYIGVEQHPIFERNGDDILCDIPISYAQAALGDHIEVPTISGMGKLRIPAGTQSGQAFRMKNQGVPNVKGYGRGDEIVRVHIDTPKKLSKEEKALLEQLFDLEKNNPSDQRAGFLDKLKDLFD